MIEEMQYRIGLSLLAKVTPALVRRMVELGMDAEEFFKLSQSALSSRLGLEGPGVITDRERQEVLSRARREADFVERHNIRVYSLSESDYPLLLREIPDAPIVLYQLGSADLDGDHLLSIVGTRRASGYGTNFCESVVDGLSSYFRDLKVVSGLALGIDSAAHVAALAHGVCTIGVVAHGLDTIYPASNRDLARRILNQGGAILSQYPSGTTPFAARFLERNRIVAGLSQFTLVAESPVKGGAMSTANLAFQYNRDVGALPGRNSDEGSRGCNLLIKRQKAHLVESHLDIMDVMGWKAAAAQPAARQRNLFPELTGNGSAVYEAIRRSGNPVALDSLHMLTGLSVSELLATLTDLEFEGIICRLPGNRFEIS